MSRDITNEVHAKEAGRKELAEEIMEVIGTHKSKEWDRVLKILEECLKEE